MFSGNRLAVALICAAAVLAAAWLPPGALAADGLLTGISDPSMTGGTGATLDAFAPRWKAAGVDVAMVTADWRRIAPSVDSPSMPAGFDPADPQSAAYDWERLDRTIATLRRNDLDPLLTITGPGPLWGSSDPSRGSARYRPDAAQFAAFASAVASRYGADVNRYIIWYEPNSDENLRPQYFCSRGKCAPRSPSIYRELFNAGSAAIRQADAGPSVYAGALAPRGATPSDSDSSMRPIVWMRSFGCLSDGNTADRTSATCRDLSPAAVDGFAYHPDQRAAAPSKHLAHWAEAGVGDTGRLTNLLDRLQETGGLINAEDEQAPINLYYTEFGYQTNPPDVFSGVSVAKQSAWLQQAARIAFGQPRVKLLGQYLWRDQPITDSGQGTDAYAGTQSGLYMFDGSAKPSARTFLNPFWVLRSRDHKTAKLWGQVRPGSSHNVTIERRVGSASFRRIASLKTDANGFFSYSTRLYARSTFRFAWTGRVGNGASQRRRSSSMTVAPR
ncbi:MAG: hypothetical protein F2813_04445 [Actinobacteria bacterium]|uniref:Unannotated protein n=1 Tax=freshwater metagenome TaxID=449393 RepID=A0A6J5ZS01_9ZZZZ|nr:hypothetical protein [Actinomycetota bacterium]